jgi:hypothetical protein
MMNAQASPNAGMAKASVETPDPAQMAQAARQQLKEAQMASEHHRAQSEKHEVLARQAEQVAEACRAVLNVLAPDEDRPVKWTEAPDAY